MKTRTIFTLIAAVAIATSNTSADACWFGCWRHRAYCASGATTTATPNAEYKPTAIEPTGDTERTPEQSLLTEVNAMRARYGLTALTLDERLTAGAAARAAICSRISRLEHSSGVAEILAQEYSEKGAVALWMHSAPHRALMLSNAYRSAGVAIVRDANGRAWCCVQFSAN